MAIVCVENGEKSSKKVVLAGQPRTTIPPEIVGALTGISDTGGGDAPSFEDIADEVLARLRTPVWAHNARFDYVSQNAFRRAGKPFPRIMLCTVRLSRRLFRASTTHSLDDLIARHALVRPLDTAAWAMRASRGNSCSAWWA